LTAGALTLELGIPHADPREGATLAASHRRAREAGTTTESAIHLLGEIARRSPSHPLVAIVQWGAIQASTDRAALLVGLSEAGAAAVLPIGVPLSQLAGVAAEITEFGMETVFSCYADTPAVIRRMALNHCTGCLYVPRSRGLTGAAAPMPRAALEELFEQLARETDLPLVVGFGVSTGADVAEICASRAVAACVGSALVKHLAAGGPPDDFVRQLLGR
jgi:tryptophan synthase alpha chain